MKTNKTPQEQILWTRWLTDNDSEAANELIENYMYLVSFHVERIISHLPSNVSRDDLKSLALFGLFDALKKFELSRNLKFDTYASFRIRGAIIDGLRKEDWLPRSLREKTKKIEQASQELEQKLHRTPTAEEIAELVNMSAQDVETFTRDSLYANVLSLEEKPKDTSNDTKEGIGYSVPDERAVSPAENMLQIEMRQELLDGMKLLNKNEQMVISLFYNDELTLTEVGQVLGLTTSRISQIHKKAIFKLRKSLKNIQALA